MSRVRIVGGAWRSRLLEVAAVPGLRPTPDRVRETLFNWLGQDLDGQHCLDLFAGTGILGLEAASRGAEVVVLVERDPRALDALHKAAKTLQASQVEIVRGDAVRFAETTPRSFDGVFLDPPYKQGWIERVQPWLDRIAAVFVPTVVGVAAVAFALWLIFGGDLEQALAAAVAVLVIACPCALGLATPAAVTAAVPNSESA